MMVSTGGGQSEVTEVWLYQQRAWCFEAIPCSLGGWEWNERGPTTRQQGRRELEMELTSPKLGEREEQALRATRIMMVVVTPPRSPELEPCWLQAKSSRGCRIQCGVLHEGDKDGIYRIGT